MLGWVSKLAAEVQQFGHDCVESIVGEEEEETTSQPGAASSANLRTEAEVAPGTMQEEASPTRSGSDGEEDWAPTELRFVGQQTQQLASLGWGLVEKGAGIALSLLGDDTDSGSPQRSSADTSALDELAQNAKAIDGESAAAAAKVSANSDEHPLMKLRACRGYLGMLRRQSHASESDENAAVARQTAARIIQPRAVAEWDFSDELRSNCVWVEGTMVGRRMVTTRQLLTAPVDPETGDMLEGERVVAVLPEFQRMSQEACDAIARMVMEELADIFARPSRNLESSLADLLVARRGEQADEAEQGVTAYWFLHKGSDANATGQTLSEQTAAAVMALATFAFCEMHQAGSSLSQVAQECAAWARRTEHPDAKIIKEKCMTVRGECLSANVDALVMLEEALEIVVSIFPAIEGTLPFEPLRIGQPIEYIRGETVLMETEHGEVQVQALDRHTRHDQTPEEPAPTSPAVHEEEDLTVATREVPTDDDHDHSNHHHTKDD
eukprot:CAMPEP_0176429920 /NCGR_PEP_ID=MMETSP0127-20121128/13970_1 /TAXON_ID=938130 /ORGANISM="Platyophrya macrostoma, Strain WH" /LENGTH=495 /DNA_ID=CAMNT_0017811761 /DNA_START=26 /DNA_END=1513 /DNA_ORIENTATION=-